MSKRQLLGLAAVPVFVLIALLPQARKVHAQMKVVKDSPVYAAMLLQDEANGQVYRVTVKNGQLSVKKFNKPLAEPR